MQIEKIFKNCLINGIKIKKETLMLKMYLKWSISINFYILKLIIVFKK